MTGRTEERIRLWNRAVALIERLGTGARDDAARDALLRDIATWQAQVVEPYRRLVDARGGTPGQIGDLASIPALPTDVFRFTRVAAHPPEQDERVFRTSGTSAGPRGNHPLRDLGLYDLAARTAARYALFPDVERMRLVVLAPHESEAPDSSLSYMLTRFSEWFGAGSTVWAWRDDRLDLEALDAALSNAETTGAPLALLGTSFAFVHADDGLGARRFSLPRGSRIMHTGGFKGRTRTLDPGSMRAALSARYGVRETFIVAEYGMTELCSQMYETTLRDAVYGGSGVRRLWTPGWVRATPVDPEGLQPVSPGEQGLLRIDDVANVDSVCAVQTADLGECVEDGIVLHGRAGGATPRGCSLAVDEALGEAHDRQGR